MALHYELLYKQLQEALKTCMLSQQEEKIILEQCYQHSYRTWYKLKCRAIRDTFETVGKEIHFYKTIIPLFIAEIKYYNLKYHAAWFSRNEAGREQYAFWQREFQIVKNFFGDYESLWMYYRSGNTSMDRYYFIRENNDITFMPSINLFNAKDRTTTNFSDIIATFLALERYEVYINEQLVKCLNM